METLPGLINDETVAPASGIVAPGVVVFSTTRAFAERAGRTRDGVARRLREIGSIGPDDVLVFAEQVHGGVVREAPRTGSITNALWVEVDGCDGLWTREPGEWLVIRTADCVPVVVWSTDGRWVGAVHAGWRGTRSGIVATLVREALDDGIAAEDLRAWVGPAISGPAYEVSEDLAGDFAGAFAGLGGGWLDGRRLNLPRLNALQLAEHGIDQSRVVQSELCTYSNPSHFPSYRRDGECRGQVYTVIGISEQNR